MSLFLIAYKSPQSDEKEKCNKYFVLYRRILFTGKTLAPSSSSCSLPVLYIIILLKKKKKDLLELPAALYLALSLAVGHRWCIFQSKPVRTHSHSRIENRRQLQIFSMPNILRASATHRRFPQIVSLIIHTARLSLAGTSADLPPISGICRRFIKTCWRVKNRAKIVQCELGISDWKIINIRFLIWKRKLTIKKDSLQQ